MSIFEEAFNKRRKKRVSPTSVPVVLPKTEKTKSKTKAKNKAENKTGKKDLLKTQKATKPKQIPSIKEEEIVKLEGKIKTLELKLRVLSDRLGNNTLEQELKSYINEQLQTIQQSLQQPQPQTQIIIPSFLWIDIREALETQPHKYRSIINQMRTRWDRPYRDVAELTYKLIIEQLKQLNPEIF